MDGYPSHNSASSNDDAPETNDGNLCELKQLSTGVRPIDMNEKHHDKGKGNDSNNDARKERPDGKNVEKLQKTRNTLNIIVAGIVCLAGFFILFFVIDTHFSATIPDSIPSQGAPNEIVSPQSFRMKTLQMQLQQYYDAGTDSDGEAELYTKETPQYKAVEWMVESDSYSELLLDTVGLYDKATTGEDIEIPRKILEALYERYALVTLFMATNEDSNQTRGSTHNAKRAWTNKYGFMSENSVCKWHDEEKKRGVFCDENTGSVQSLILADNDMKGTLPYELKGLKSLQHLDIQSNKQLIVEYLPSTGLMESIELANTPLKIPQDEAKKIFGNLLQTNPDLKLLNLGNTDLSGDLAYMIAEDDWTYATNLRILVFAGNDFAGPLPESLSKLKMLEKLSMGGNKFTQIPSSWFDDGSFPFLKELLLSRNQLKGMLPSPPSPEMTGKPPMPMLQRLGLERNQLFGTIPATLAQLSNIQTLDLSCNALTGGLPVELIDLLNLKVLYLEGNKLEGDLSKLPENSFSHLEQLHLNFNEFSGDINGIFCKATDTDDAMQASNTTISTIPDLRVDCIDKVACNCCTVCDSNPYCSI